MNEPMPNEPSGAIHQKRGLANTVLTPAHCAAIPPLAAGGAVSGTRHQIQAAMPKENTDSTMNTPRQSVNRSAISTGVVATSAPTPPATMIQAASDACRSAGYHAEIAFSGAIRHTDTPSPISARATMRPVTPSASAKASVPMPQNSSSAGSTRRGP